MHCKNCKFWTHTGAYKGKTASGVCDRIDWDNDNPPPDGDAILFADALDDSGLRAELRTGPDFGCLKFQKA